jgi:hypothetical protein
MSERKPSILIAPIRLTDEDAIQVMKSWGEKLVEQGFRVVSFDYGASRIPEEAADTDAVLVPCAVFGQEDFGYPMSPQTLRVIRYAAEHKKTVFSEAPLAKHFESSQSDDGPASNWSLYRLPSGYVLPELPEGFDVTIIGQDIDVLKEKLGE